MPGDAVGHGTQSRTRIAGFSQLPGPTVRFVNILIPPVPRPRTLANTGPSGDALVFADHFACYRVPSPPRFVSISVICPPKSINSNIESPYVLVYNRLLPSPDGGSFPSTWTIHLTQKAVLLAMVHPSSFHF